MLASIFAAAWFATFASYAIAMLVQVGTQSSPIPRTIGLVSLVALAIAVIPIILLAV